MRADTLVYSGKESPRIPEQGVKRASTSFDTPLKGIELERRTSKSLNSPIALLYANILPVVAFPLEAETAKANNSPTLRAVSSRSRIQERARALGQNKPQQQVFNQILLHEVDAGSVEGFGTGLTSEIISPQILPPQTAPQQVNQVSQVSQVSQVNQVKEAQDQAQQEGQEAGVFLNRSLGGISQGGVGRIKQRRVIEEEHSESEEGTDESESEEEEEEDSEEENSEKEDSEERVSTVSENSSARSIFGPHEDELTKCKYSNFRASIVGEG